MTCCKTDEPHGLPMPRTEWLGPTAMPFECSRTWPREKLEANTTGTPTCGSSSTNRLRSQVAATEYAYEDDRKIKPSNLFALVLEPEGSKTDGSKDYEYIGPGPDDDPLLRVNWGEDAPEDGRHSNGNILSQPRNSIQLIGQDSGLQRPNDIGQDSR